MKIIVPCCGRSSRFPGLPPKWLLPNYQGTPMLKVAVGKLQCDPSEIVVVILREHEQRFNAAAGLRAALGAEVQIVILEEPTSSQSETVYLAVRQAGLTGAIFIKDSDNAYALGNLAQDYNYVCVDSLNNHDLINPRNKSYVVCDTNGLMVNIREKQVISDVFSVGGYYFRDSAEFARTYEALAKTRQQGGPEIYISDVIGRMLTEGAAFYSKTVTQYQDFGTTKEWQSYLLGNRVFLVAVDGLLFERGFEHFAPLYPEVKPMPEIIARLAEISGLGAQLVYLSVRPEEFRAITQTQLQAAGLPEGKLVMGLLNSAWTLITPPHPVLSMASSESMVVDPKDSVAISQIAGQR